VLISFAVPQKQIRFEAFQVHLGVRPDFIQQGMRKNLLTKLFGDILRDFTG